MQFKRSPLPESTLPYSFGPHVRQVLKRLPQSVVAKLSEEELLALYKTMTGPRHHSADMRISLPLVPKRLYFVTLIGLERRSQPRGKTPQNWTNASIRMAMSLGLFAGLALGGAGYHAIQSQKASTASNTIRSKQVALASEMTVHPAALPWVEKQTDCQGKSRQWQAGLCYEQNHDPQF